MKTSQNDLTLSTTTYHSSTSTSSPQHYSININLKIIAILAAGLVLVIIIIRICIMLTTSNRSRNNSSPIHRTNFIQPQIAIIEQNTFKADLPPDYTEAIANIETDESKLPSYDELNNEQCMNRRITT